MDLAPLSLVLTMQRILIYGFGPYQRAVFCLEGAQVIDIVLVGACARCQDDSVCATEIEAVTNIQIVLLAPDEFSGTFAEFDDVL